MIPKGLCVDLETTLTLKIPNHVRPIGEKRYETRLLEIGAVAWDNPTLTFGCLVNPIPPRETIQSPKELFDYMLSVPASDENPSILVESVGASQLADPRHVLGD